MGESSESYFNKATILIAEDSPTQAEKLNPLPEYTGIWRNRDEEREGSVGGWSGTVIGAPAKNVWARVVVKVSACVRNLSETDLFFVVDLSL
jgi:hypothetical protein